MLPHPDLKTGEERGAVLPADGKTFFRRLAVDGAFNIEQGVDAADRLKRQGRDHGGLLALRPGSGGRLNISKLEEPAPAM